MALFKRPRPVGHKQGNLVPKRDAPKTVRLALTREEYALLVKLTNQSSLRDRARFIRWLVDLWAEVQATGDKEGSFLFDSDDPPPQLGIMHKSRETGKWVFRPVKLPNGWDKG